MLDSDGEEILDLNAASRQALVEWCECTGEDVDGEGADAARMVYGKHRADDILRIAADMYTTTPPPLREFHPLQLVDVVIGLDDLGVLPTKWETAARQFEDSILATAPDEFSAALATLDQFPAGEYTPKVRDRDPRGRTDNEMDAEIEEIRVFALNTTPVVEFFCTDDGTWILYTHHAG